LHTTSLSRGSPGYRAPELLIPSGGRYNNKVDIWALGCILYELVSYKKPFHDDLAVALYRVDASRAVISMPEAPEWPRSLRSHLHHILKDLLAVEVTLRPSASDVAHLFSSYQLLLKPSVVEVIEEVNLLPPFSEWQNIVKSTSTDRELLLCLAALSEKNNHYDIAMRLRKSLVELYSDVQLRNQLAEAQLKNDESGSAIRVWSSLVDHHPEDTDLQNRLSSAFEERAEPSLAIHGWKELVNKHPTVKGLQKQLSKTLKLCGDLDTSIRTWKELAEQHLDIPVLLGHLADAYEAKGDVDAEITGWKELIEASPHVPWLQSRLASVYKRQLSGNTQLADDELSVKAWSKVMESMSASGDIWSTVQLADSYFKDKRYTDALALYDMAITISKLPEDVMDLRIKKSLVYQAKGAHQEAIELLKQLVVNSPNNIWLQNKLSDAYQLIGDYTAESQTWNELIESNPDHLSLKFKLAEAYQKLEDFDGAISYLSMLCSEYPNNSILRDQLRQAHDAKGDPDAAIIALPTNDTENDDATSDYGSMGGLTRGYLDEEIRRSAHEVTPVTSN
jgi:tetratricopeptide (TPR) repeat protein